ncbi:MAG: hypothetical protein JSS86_02395 [Cyanobacteria bacterium SZAS LIN-2]|nr:hypothetical protein [Cyanobacteria bacterium SZAS LIN-2]
MSPILLQCIAGEMDATLHSLCQFPRIYREAVDYCKARERDVLIANYLLQASGFYAQACNSISLQEFDRAFGQHAKALACLQKARERFDLVGPH